MRTRSGGQSPIETPGDIIDPSKLALPEGSVFRNALAEGHTLTVTWGKETFQPLQFHALELGPYQLTATIQPGETAVQAWSRAMVDLDQIAERDFADKLEKFFGRVQRVAARAADVAPGNRRPKG